MSVKACTGCRTTKPTTDFYKNKGKTMPNCKACHKAAVRARYYANHDKVVAYERERSQRPERKAKVLEYQRRRRKLHPEKNKARNAVGNALRDGRLVRKPCEVCGNPETEAHHRDYSKPLDVQWLCFDCHRTYGHGQITSRAS